MLYDSVEIVPKIVNYWALYIYYNTNNELDVGNCGCPMPDVVIKFRKP